MCPRRQRESTPSAAEPEAVETGSGPLGRLPVVAIVGRPNVGKSTLFNRIVRKRIAIVEEWAGVTRDRITAEVKRNDAHFELIDTGGVGVVDRDDLSAEVEEQIWAAARQADVLLFLLDARDGPLAEDRVIAQRVRQLDRPVIVVVNKVDHHGLDSHVPEFASLALGEPIPISALEGVGITDLVAAIAERLPRLDPPPRTSALRVAVVGKRNVGKSTLVNALCGEARMIVSDVPGTTRDAVDVPFRLGGRDYVLVDTAGLRKPGKVADSVEFFSHARTRSALRSADVALLLVDSTQEIADVDQKLAGFVEDRALPVIITLSKWDLAKARKKVLADYEEYVRENFPGLAFAPISAISAKDKINLKPTLNLAAKLHEQSGLRIGTGELNKAVDELTRNWSVPYKGTVQGKIYYATQVDVNPPRFVFMVNKTKVFHQAYRRRVENFLRDRFPFGEIPLALVFRERKSMFKE